MAKSALLRNRTNADLRLIANYTVGGNPVNKVIVAAARQVRSITLPNNSSDVVLTIAVRSASVRSASVRDRVFNVIESLNVAQSFREARFTGIASGNGSIRINSSLTNNI